MYPILYKNFFENVRISTLGHPFHSANTQKQIKFSTVTKIKVLYFGTQNLTSDI